MQIKESLKTFFIKCGRVWQVLKKPSREEFVQVSKVSAIGIILLGALGFLISIIMKIIVR